MPRLSDLSGHNLRWLQPSALKEEYELQAGDRAVAKLHFPSSFKAQAVATTPEGTWYFDRPGFWQRRAVARSTEGVELAVFQPNTWKGGGILTLADGRTLTAAGNFWMTQFSFVNEFNQPLVEYMRIGGFFHASCDVMIQPSLQYAEELEWLVVFGWYLIVMQRKDSAAAAAA